jgi:hypothetical protein
MATIDGKKAATAAEKAKYEAEQDKRILRQLAQEEAALDADRAKQVRPCRLVSIAPQFQHRRIDSAVCRVPSESRMSKIRQAKMAAERAAKGAAGAAVVEKGLKKMITDSGANPKDAGVAEM